MKDKTNEEIIFDAIKALNIYSLWQHLPNNISHCQNSKRNFIEKVSSLSKRWAESGNLLLLKSHSHFTKHKDSDICNLAILLINEPANEYLQLTLIIRYPIIRVSEKSFSNCFDNINLKGFKRINLSGDFPVIQPVICKLNDEIAQKSITELKSFFNNQEVSIHNIDKWLIKYKVVYFPGILNPNVTGWIRSLFIMTYSTLKHIVELIEYVAVCKKALNDLKVAEGKKDHLKVIKWLFTYSSMANDLFLLEPDVEDQFELMGTQLYLSEFDDVAIKDVEIIPVYEFKHYYEVYLERYLKKAKIERINHIWMDVAALKLHLKEQMHPQWYLKGFDADENIQN